MSKFKILFFIFILLFISSSLFSKTMILKCDKFFFKINEPILGFKKAYMIKGYEWSKIRDFEVTDTSYILKNIYPNQSKCNINECRVNIKLKKNIIEKSYLAYKSIVINSFCKIDGGNKCYERKIGKNLEKGYCSKINNKDINFNNGN